MVKKIALIIILLGANQVFAQQDKSMSMWSQSPMMYNAGSVATGEEDYSFFTNFRYQWFTVGNKPMRTNILNASLLAMKRAIKKLKKKPSHVLIDGNKLPNMKNYKLKSIIKGDQKIPSISAASIIAKVTRDKMISDLGKKFKGYNWQKNFGYGTSQHLKAIKILGITKHHRKTFSPINKLK